MAPLCCCYAVQHIHSAGCATVLGQSVAHRAVLFHASKRVVLPVPDCPHRGAPASRWSRRACSEKSRSSNKLSCPSDSPGHDHSKNTWDRQRACKLHVRNPQEGNWIGMI